MPRLKHLRARQILDSRGNPTIEVSASLEDGTYAKAAVPSGASTGSHEAHELRDEDPRYFHGKGVDRAIENVNGPIAEAMVNLRINDQSAVDQRLIELDGTENKSLLGANAILGVSLALARAYSASQKIPLFSHIANLAARPEAVALPLPMFNVMNGGVHADSSLDFQEFMIAPVGAKSMRDAVRMASETYHSLKALLKQKGYSIAVGDEGGFAPNLRANDEAIELILEAIELGGYKTGKDIAIALDPAASEFYREGYYQFLKSDRRN